MEPLSALTPLKLFHPLSYPRKQSQLVVSIRLPASRAQVLIVMNMKSKSLRRLLGVVVGVGSGLLWGRLVCLARFVSPIL